MDYAFFSNTLLGVGVLILFQSLRHVRRIMQQLPVDKNHLRTKWTALALLIVFFIVGYCAYLGLFWQSQTHLVDLIVPAIFFFGAWFVWLSTRLSLQTAIDFVYIAQLEQETWIDPLTGAFNRRYLHQRLSKEVYQSQKYQMPLALIMIDLDHFKLINDQYGHLAGDQMLSEMCRIIRAAVRKSDSVTRYGGEEFLIILSKTHGLKAAQIAEYIRSQVEEHIFIVKEPSGKTKNLSMTISVGIAMLSEHIDSLDKLIESADSCLYQAKDEGRNKVVAPYSSAKHPLTA